MRKVVWGDDVCRMFCARSASRELPPEQQVMADSLTRQVSECTDVMKVQFDWGAGMALCDEVNNVGDKPLR